MVTLENTAYSLSQLDNISATAQALLILGEQERSQKEVSLVIQLT